jgi:hypothetical protein
VRQLCGGRTGVHGYRAWCVFWVRRPNRLRQGLESEQGATLVSVPNRCVMVRHEEGRVIVEVVSHRCVLGEAFEQVRFRIGEESTQVRHGKASTQVRQQCGVRKGPAGVRSGASLG